MAEETATAVSQDRLRGLEGKVVLITGAARGQGAFHVHGFAGAGARVVALDVPRPVDASYGSASVEELDATVASAAQRSGSEVIAVRADLRSESEIKAAVAEAVSRFGRIDILVNNAGTAAWDPITEMRPEMVDLLVDTNVKGTIYVTKHVVGHMIAQGAGRIVNITSAVIAASTINLSHYVATKHAIVGLTEAWASELSPHGINVNAVAPGPIDPGRNDAPNGMSRGLAGGLGLDPDEFFETVSSTANLPGAMWRIDGSDITDAVMFLSSDNARMITGHVLHVDAGQAVR